MSEIDDKKMDETEKKDEETVEVESNSKSLKDAEKEEEAKLRAKYPEMKASSGSSALLQKRLSKGQKYFDSGDYNMAKAKTGSSKLPNGPGQKLDMPGSTGDAIPTPESVPHKKMGFNKNKLAGMS